MAFRLTFDDAFVVGRTVSTNFPVTANAFSPALQRTNNSFLALIEMDRALLGTVAGSNIELKWGASLISPQYHLQTSPVDSGGWSNIIAPSTVVNGYNAVTLPLTNGIGFFRLER